MTGRAPLPLLTALGCAAALVVVAALALVPDAGHERDAAIMHGFGALDSPSRHAALDAIAHLADPVPYGLLGIALAGLALARGRGRHAVAVLVLLLVTGATTQLLKQLLAEPRVVAWLGSDSPSDTSWPSGHATAAMTLALCAVLAVGPRLRAVAVVLGGAFALLVGFAIVALYWHYPSDVLGGYLIATLWTALALAVLAGGDRPIADAPKARWSSLVMAAAIAGAVVVAAIAAEDRVARYAAERPSLVLGAAVLAVAAIALPAATSRLLTA